MFIVKDSRTTKENLSNILKAIDDALPDYIDKTGKKDCRAALQEIKHIRNELEYLLSKE